MVPYKSTTKEVLFEWSHYRISSTDLKSYTNVFIIDSGSERSDLNKVIWSASRFLALLPWGFSRRCPLGAGREKKTNWWKVIKTLRVELSFIVLTSRSRLLLIIYNRQLNPPTKILLIKWMHDWIHVSLYWIWTNMLYLMNMNKYPTTAWLAKSRSLTEGDSVHICFQWHKVGIIHNVYSKYVLWFMHVRNTFLAFWILTTTVEDVFLPSDCQKIKYIFYSRKFDVELWNKHLFVNEYQGLHHYKQQTRKTLSCFYRLDGFFDA